MGQVQNQGEEVAGDEGALVRLLQVELARGLPQAGASQRYLVPRIRETGLNLFPTPLSNLFPPGRPRGIVPESKKRFAFSQTPET